MHPVPARLLLAIAGAAEALAAAPRPASADAFADLQPLLARHCHDCHGAKKQKADLNLAAFPDEAAVQKNRPVWKKVWEKILSREMPPSDHKPKLPDADRARLVDWIEKSLSHLPGTAVRDPGRVVIRRLNRTEYRNTIRELLGVEAAVDDFPSDDIGYGFDNIGDVLSLPPLLLEKYLDAAADALDRALVTDSRRGAATRRHEAERMIAVAGSILEKDHHRLVQNGELTQEIEVKQDGRYLLRVRAGADANGGEAVRMAVKLDGQEAQTFEVRASRSRPVVHETSVAMKAGTHTAAIAFLNDKRKPGAPPPPAKGRVRCLQLDWLEVAGPIDLPPPVYPETHKRVFIAAPAPDRRKAAREIVAAFAARAFRRPPAPEEVERLLRPVDAADKRGDAFEAAVAFSLQAALVSPHFLFRIEADRPGDDPRGVRPVDGWELASRLSYFLWSGMPDEELFARARKGDLTDPAVLDAQVARMLKDPRAKALAENFAAQWLQIRRLESASPDRGRFPAWDDGLRAAMTAEVTMFFESVLREDRSVLTLLDADYTFANEQLARHYGIEGVTGGEMRRVPLADARRGGVLTMAGILTANSNATRTSPVKRGKWVLEVLLNAPPPPPLPGADNLKEKDKPDEKVSLRKRLEQHRANPDCATCHERMDPLGFGLENFDAVGAWREQDEGLPLDTAAVLPDGSAFQGPVELKAILLARKDDFARCLAEKMLTYALGRGVEPCDAPAVRGIVNALAADRYRFSTLVREVVKSYPFLHRRNRALDAPREDPKKP
jgi:mono/diheme cytochrome c family protein